MKKTLILTTLIILTSLISGCAGKQELTKQQKSMFMVMEKTMDMQTAIATELIKKDDCSFKMNAVPGKEILNLASIAFTCNNSDRGRANREFGNMLQSFAKVMTYSPAAEISKHGFKALTTLGLAGLGAWTVTNNQDNWADAVNSANSAWGGAVGDVASNNLREVIETNTISDISDTVTEHVTDTVTTTTDTTNTTYVDTFGIGNTWNLGGDWGNNPFLDPPSINP